MGRPRKIDDEVESEFRAALLERNRLIRALHPYTAKCLADRFGISVNGLKQSAKRLGIVMYFEPPALTERQPSHRD